MKLLLDTCVWGGAAPELRAIGHDVIWAGEWDQDPGDLAIMRRAHDEARVLVTLDKDFGELAISGGHPHAGIIRIVNFRAGQQAAVCQNIIETYQRELAEAALITVEPGQVRIRRMDSGA